MDGIVLGRTLEDFLASWRVERTLRHDDGTEGQFAGEAIWHAEQGGALYVEKGKLWPGREGPFTAERRYRWATDLTVCFEDGRVFHQVPPCGGAVGHWCPPDQYDGHYDFSAWPEWQVVWHVSGPRKSYVSTTLYTPSG